MTAADHTITETIEHKIYLIFNANGGTVGVEKKTLRTGDSFGSLPTSTKQGAIFVGWFDETTATHDS